MLSSIISLYKKVQRNISESSSGKCKFNLILSFISGCGKTFNTDPPFALIKDFISILLDIILKSDISYTDPSKLNTVKYILNKSRNEYLNSKNGDVIITQIDKAADILNMQLLKSYFYLGKYDDGLIVLKDMLEQRDTFFGEQTDKPRNKIHRTKDIKTAKYALVNPEIYKESKAYEILTEIKSELNRLNSYSDTSINVLLVEHDSKNAGFSGGTIQNLICNTMKASLSKEEPIEFDNITDFNDLELQETLKEISTAANVLIKYISGKSVPPKTKRTLRFQNVRGIYKGSSLGVGSTIIASCNYFNYINSKRRYKISNAAAFTGVVNKDGKVLKVSGESIKDKVEAAFFSWVKYCVVPKENYNDAVSTSEELKKIYPTKELEVIGIETVEEVFNHPEIVQIETLGSFEYTRSVIERNKFKSTAALIVMLVLLTLILSIKFLPKDRKPLPKTDSEMYLIYAPDREPGWIFNNADYYGGDTINFGDVAIGDQWFPVIEFWNNGRGTEEFDVFVEGRDKDEFQSTWLYKKEQPDAPGRMREDISQILYVKFVPTKDDGDKRATLIFENKETKHRKEIFLKGVSKRFNNGYCIDIGESDDLLLLEPNTNLIQSNMTISMWIKPYYIDTTVRGNILTNENNPLTNNKFNLFSYSNGKVGVDVAGSKSREIPIYAIRSDLKLIKNQWNFLSVIFGDTTITLVLNDKAEVYPAEKNYLRIMDDCIFSGIYRPADRGRDYDAPIYMKFYMDELKIYKKVITVEELIQNRLNPDYRKKDVLVYYTFEDATPRRVYDASRNDFWPRLYGGVRRVIDSEQPFKRKITSVKTSTGKNTVFKTDGKGFLRLNKNLFQMSSSFTFQCDYKVVLDSIHEDVSLLQPFFPNKPSLDISLRPGRDSVYLYLLNGYEDFMFKKGITAGSFKGWTRYTMSYDSKKNEFRFYINNKEVFSKNDFFPTDITKNYMGISFALINYFGSPRFISKGGSAIDNLKLFNRAISGEEIYSDTKDGLIAYWTFENTDKELAYDNVSGLPLLMIEPFELKTEDVDFIR